MATIKLTFHRNTPANRKRYLKLGKLYLTIYSGAVNISRSIYHGEKGKIASSSRVKLLAIFTTNRTGRAVIVTTT